MKILTLFLGIFPALFSFGQAYQRDSVIQQFMLQDYAAALDFLRSYPMTSSYSHADSMQYLNDLGYCWYMEERPAEAMKVYDQILDIDSMNRQANLYRSQIFANAKDWGNATDAAEKLVETDSLNYRFWYRLGSFQLSGEGRRAALGSFRRAYVLNPRSSNATVQFAKGLSEAGQRDSAMACLQEFLQRDSSNEDVITEWIENCYAIDSFRQVLYWGHHLLDDSVQAYAAYVRLAYAHLNLEEYAACEKVCDWMIDQSMGNQTVLYCNAIAKAKLRKFDESNQVLDECLHLSIDRESKSYFEAKGDNFESLKNYRKAIACYDTAFYIFGKAIDLYFIGRIHDKYLHSESNARKYYLRYLRLQPKPSSEGERRIHEYITAYLAEKKR